MELLRGKKRVGIITNAQDVYPDPEVRQEKMRETIAELEAIGLHGEELDLRGYFGKQDMLAKRLDGYDGLWVRGGNSFVLRKAMHYSGFDEIIRDMLASDSIVYGGYSAGACVMGKDMHGLDLCDEPNATPAGYKPETIWEGLGVVPYAVVPHYKSDNPESMLIDKTVAYMDEHNLPYKTLRDGEVLMIDNNDEMSKVYDVVILPAASVQTIAEETSEEFERLGSLFTLKQGECYPHVSLYMLQLDTDSVEAVKNRLAAIASSTAPLHLRVTRYWQAMQFFDAEYEKSNEIGLLQEEVVSALNPLRDGMRPKAVEHMKEAVGLAFENFQKYGWDTIGELYRPHLTLTRFTRDQDIDSLSLPDIGMFTGSFNSIGLFEMGDNGTCVHKVAEFELSGQ